ncbi:hypothetical protein F5Y11DRAFT_354901 [Daldinia sp. FL1419]|nr:hypothetical protein F5Y11DRAFT_354901 [Daldinia sp. FL1419]
MYPSEPAILAALSSYRAHISSHNHRAFEVIIPDITAADPDDPDLFESDEEMEEARLDFTSQLVGDHHGTHPPITRPSDVLTHWEALAPQLGLDGVTVNYDTAWRDGMRDVYKRGVIRGLNERCSGTVTMWEFPSDLAVVLQHVDSLVGPGWYKYREQHESVVFFEGLVCDGGPGGNFLEDLVSRRVRTASEIINRTVGLGEDRPRDVDDERGWSWRYVACLGQFGTHVFENVVKLLEWYKSYGEPREADWGVSAGEVFQA